MKKKALLVVMMLCLLACFRPAFAEAADRGAESSATKVTSGDVVSLSGTAQTWCIDVKGSGNLKMIGSGYEFYAKVWNKSGSVDTSITVPTYKYENISFDKADTFYIQASGVGRTLEILVEEAAENGDIEHAKVIDVPMNGEITVTATSPNPEYFVLNPDDKSYYQFTSNAGSIYFSDGTAKIDRDSQFYYNYKEGGSGEYFLTACKGAPAYFSLVGLIATNKAGSVTIKRTDFNEIKSIKFPSSKITVSGSKKITLNIGKVKDYESRIRYTLKDADGKDVDLFMSDLLKGYDESEEPTKRHIITVGNGSTTGLYTLVATTSEGLTAKAEIQLAPAKVDTAKIKSFGYTDSATITWEKVLGADKYYIYLKSGKKYKKVGETKDLSYTVKKLKADTTYSFKIAAVKTSKNSKGKKVDLVGEQTAEWKLITAPTEKPVISKLTAVKTDYVPKKWVEGTPAHYDSAGYWHNATNGYYVKDYSIAKIKFETKASKVFKSYQYEADRAELFKSGSTIGYIIDGKAGAKSQKVKVRGVKTLDKYNAIAYGKWSDEKTVTIKAAK